MRNATERPENFAPTRRQRIARVVGGCAAAAAVVAGAGILVTSSTASDIVAETAARQTSSPLPTPASSSEPAQEVSPTDAPPTDGPPTTSAGESQVGVTPVEGLPAPEDLVPTDLLDAGLGAPIAAFTNAFQALSQLETGSDGLTGLEEVADGEALMDLQAQAAEIGANEWSFEGDALVVSADIEESGASAEGESIRVLACIDSSNVVVKDLDGSIIQAADPAGSRRSLNIYDLEQRDQIWVVTNHTFPDNADC